MDRRYRVGFCDRRDGRCDVIVDGCSGGRVDDGFHRFVGYADEVLDFALETVGDLSNVRSQLRELAHDARKFFGSQEYEGYQQDHEDLAATKVAHTKTVATIRTRIRALWDRVCVAPVVVAA